MNLKNKIIEFVGQVYWREAILLSPALIISACLGIYLGQQILVLLIGAQLSLGFGASRSHRNRRWWVIITSTIFTALAATIGSLIGFNSPLFYLLLTILCASFAYLNWIDNNFWWINMQVVVALLVASYYHQDLNYALLRGGIILLAGSILLVTSYIVAKIIPKVSLALPLTPAVDLPNRVRNSYIYTVVIAVNLSLAIANYLSLSNSYWAAIAALMICKPDFKQTYLQAIKRFFGAVLGCLSADLIVHVSHDHNFILVVVLLINTAIVFSFQKANPLIMTFLATNSIVIIISMYKGNPLAVAEHRVEATFLGGLIGLILTKLLIRTPK
ncbi:FUSC family protein [Psittacicella hinzii]|uniref:Integral membrane bound transporter domain-containing protein n=1 Tax=Psittacicella hinzii TaxID=2028575 RepID=A0A3A1YT50_9GAMM|nr:FUSC family protein [Psittacicella hinzii]RIY39574.1 hypothetical protein CKF58_01935 [Psittacicella hinzii]